MSGAGRSPSFPFPPASLSRRRELVIIIARAPRRGTVKTRLARVLGEGAALRLYRALLSGLIRRLARDPRLLPLLALTPDHARDRLPLALPRLAQGQGDLGARMTRLIRRFPRRQVHLVGADIPDLAPPHIHAARKALRAGAEIVIGPALDGGFWLAGFGPRRRPPRPFAGVPWSHPETLSRLLARLAPYRVALLAPLRDLDEPEDLIAWRDARGRGGGAA